MATESTDYFPGLNIFAMLKGLTRRGIGILPTAGTPTSGTSGTFAGRADKGSLIIDYTNGLLYINTGTKASPTWAVVTPIVVSANDGLGVIGNVKMTYDFAVNGGAVSTIIPTNSPTIPIKAIILGGTIDITTTLTSGGAATIALETSAGMAAGGLKAATAVASWVAGQLALTPVFTAATYVKMTAAGRPQVTIATAALTAGKFDINLVYVMGN